MASVSTYIENAFVYTHEEYQKIFRNMYPAQDSTGFTERNQVFLFVNSLVRRLREAGDEDAIQWFELPLENKNKHIDGFVYSPKFKTVFYVEAKRINEQDKKEEIRKDIKRIIEFSHDHKKIFENHYEIFKVNKEYGIILADVWLETDWKKMVPAWWSGEAGGNSFQDYLQSDNDIGSNWENSTQRVMNFVEKYKSVSIHNYALLMSYKKLSG